MHSLYKIFPDRVDLGVFFAGGGVLIFERIEILGEEYRGGDFIWVGG